MSDPVNERLAKLSTDIAAEEQKFFEIRERYQKEAREQPREYTNAKIDEAYAIMMLVTAPMRRMRDETIKRMVEIESFKPPKQIIINV